MLGYSQSTISKVLITNKIRSCNRYRKHKINVNFFDKWSSDMAYILGFITADGSVNRYTLCINIAQRDEDVLRFITSKLGNVKIEHRVKEKSIRVRFNSVILIKSLTNYGIIPNKTNVIRMPNNIPKKYIGDYVRGIFDGDGWICHRTNRNGLAFGICSASELFIKDLSKICSNIGTTRCRDYKNHPNRNPQYYFENTTNEDAVKFRTLIYKNEGFSLKRKKEIFFSRLS
jgi:hypothetical protein